MPLNGVVVVVVDDPVEAAEAMPAAPSATPAAIAPVATILQRRWDWGVMSFLSSVRGSIPLPHPRAAT
ncbi:MAG TPA: hypothetical protein VGS61_00965 [Acidimicrobiales bacterium]|nr:hypothetical protein [Acidimicrobiales bacterium]